MAVSFSTFPTIEKLPHFLSVDPFSCRFSFGFPAKPPQTTTRTLILKQFTPRALREWKEYEEAVKRKDLARALRFLKSIENNNSSEPNKQAGVSLSAESTTPRLDALGMLEYERDWEVLDTCLNADDMRLVGSAFRFLKERGFLPNFGKFGSIGNHMSYDFILLHYCWYW